MVEGIIVGVITASIMILINALVRRTGVKTRTDRMERDIDDLKDGQAVIMRSLIAILVALRDGKTNGECADALHSINEYLTNSIRK